MARRMAQLEAQVREKIGLLKDDYVNTSSGLSRYQSHFSASPSTSKRDHPHHWNMDSTSTKSSRGSFECQLQLKSSSKKHDNTCKHKVSHLKNDDFFQYHEKDLVLMTIQ